MDTDNATEGGLTIEAQRAGRNGTATLTARLAGEVLAVEKLDLAKPKSRTDFIARLCKDREGIDAAALEGELLRLAAEVVERPEPSGDGEDEPSPFALPEVDAAAIGARPDLAGASEPNRGLPGDDPGAR